jgi:hypothetical protein
MLLAAAIQDYIAIFDIRKLLGKTGSTGAAANSAT